MKKTIYIIMALIVAFCTNLFATSVSTTVSAAEANTAVVAYDLNNDGVVNAIDLAILKQYLIKEGGETSSYHIADAVKLKKFLLGDLETSGEKLAKPAVRYSFTNSVTDEEIWFVRNQLTNTENTSITYSSGHMVIEMRWKSCISKSQKTTIREQKIQLLPLSQIAGRRFMYFSMKTLA